MRWLRRTIGAAVLVAVLIGGWRFAHENADPVAVSYLVGATARLPLWRALLWAFAAGFALAGTGWLWFAVRSRLLQRRYRKAVGGLEAEIHELRNLPLAPDAEAPGAIGPDTTRIRGGQRSG